MKIPVSWLKDFIDLDLSPQEIAKHLTMAGLEVEAIETHDPSFDGVIVGYVEEVVPHPNADKLRIATVSNGKENVQVVCGAPNCRKGMKTAFAELGASILLDNDEKLKIKKTKIRGVESNGMLASGKELRVSDEADGILDLSDEFKVGEDLKKYFLEILPEYDKEKVYISDIRKVVNWYNLLQKQDLLKAKALLKEAGYDVIKTQIINDRGIHICKSMLAWEKFGNGATPETTDTKGDKFVGNYYVEFDKNYKKEIIKNEN